MRYREKVRDLFSVPEEYGLVHCISADFAMGKGIVVEFNRRFDMKRRLQRGYPDYLDHYRTLESGGDCILEGRVFNLITKERYFHKPTIDTMRAALEQMRAICEEAKILHLAMPMIGAGLDRLLWEEVSAQIKSVFRETDVDILVCRLK